MAPQESFLQFVVSSLGVRYSILLTFATVGAFLIVAAMLLRGRGAWAAAATLLAVTLPAFVGVLAFVDGMLSSFLVVARSNATPQPAAWAEGLAMSLVSVNLGMFLTGTLLFIALIGLTVRALMEPAAGNQHAAFVPPHLPQRTPAKAV